MEATTLVKEAFTADSSYLTSRERAEAAWRGLVGISAELVKDTPLDIEAKYGNIVTQSYKGSTLPKEWASMFALWAKFYGLLSAPESPSFTPYAVWRAIAAKPITESTKAFEGKVAQASVFAALTAKPKNDKGDKPAVDYLGIAKSLTAASTKGLGLLTLDPETLTDADKAKVLSGVDAIKRLAQALESKFS